MCQSFYSIGRGDVRIFRKTLGPPPVNKHLLRSQRLCWPSGAYPDRPLFPKETKPFKPNDLYCILIGIRHSPWDRKQWLIYIKRKYSKITASSEEVIDDVYVFKDVLTFECASPNPVSSGLNDFVAGPDLIEPVPPREYPQAPGAAF